MFQHGSEMNALILKGAAPIIARAMADELDIDVQFRYGGACTDGKVIYLPNLPINDPKAPHMIRWSIGHEAAHIAYTDFNCAEVIANRDQRLHHLCNCLEDIRIESLQMRKLPGYKSFVSSGMKATENEVSLPKEGDSWSLIEHYLLTIGYRDALGISSLTDYFSACEKAAESLFSTGLLNAMKSAAIGARSMSNTAEVFGLATRLLSIIDNPPPPEPPPPDKQQGEGGDSSDEPAEDDAAAPGSAATDDDGDQAPSNGGSTPPKPGLSAEQQVALNKLLDDPTEPYKGFGEMLSDAIDKLSNNMPVELQLDPTQMNYRAARPSKDQAAMGRVTTVSNKARLRCREQMLSVRRSERTYHASGSRLSASKVTNIMRGDYRVFERISEGINTNCAVLILLDASGFMSSTMPTARDSALSLAVALQGIDGVSVSIAAFPANIVGLPFGGKIADFAGNISKQSYGGGTPLAEALMANAPALLSQTNPRKVCFIITDGEPNSVGATREAIDHLKTFGVEMIGVGIQHDISGLIPCSRQVDNLADLPKAIFEAITEQARNRQ